MLLIIDNSLHVIKVFSLSSFEIIFLELFNDIPEIIEGSVNRRVSQLFRSKWNAKKTVVI